MLARYCARLAREGVRLRYAADHQTLTHINNFLRMMTHVLNLHQRIQPRYMGYQTAQEITPFHEGPEGQQRQATLHDFAQTGDYGALMAYLDQMNEAGAGQGTESHTTYPGSTLLSLLHQLAGHAGAAVTDPTHPMLHPQVGALHPLIAGYHMEGGYQVPGQQDHYGRPRRIFGGGEFIDSVLQGLRNQAGASPQVLQDLVARGLMHQQSAQRMPALSGHLEGSIGRAHNRVLGGSLAHMGPLLALLRHAHRALEMVDPSYGVAAGHGLDVEEPYIAADEAQSGLHHYLDEAVVPHLTGGQPIG